MDLGVRILSYEVVAAPETPTGVAVVVQRAQIMPQLSTRADTAQVWPRTDACMTNESRHGRYHCRGLSKMTSRM